MEEKSVKNRLTEEERNFLMDSLYGKPEIRNEEFLNQEGCLKKVEVSGYSIIAVNLRKVEEIDEIIRRCEAIKRNMIDGIPFGYCAYEYVPNTCEGKRFTNAGSRNIPDPISKTVIHFPMD